MKNLRLTLWITLLLALAISACKPAAPSPTPTVQPPTPTTKPTDIPKPTAPPPTPTAQPVAEWSFTAAGPVLNSAYAEESHVYFGSLGGVVYAVDRISREELWKLDAKDPFYSPPIVDEKTIYIGAETGLYAIERSTGKQLWKFTTPALVGSKPALAEGIVYFGDLSGGIYAVDAASGKELWKLQAGPVISSPAIAGDKMLIGSADGFLYALDRKTGEKKWLFLAEGAVLSSPVVAGEIVYVGSGSTGLNAGRPIDENPGRMYAINLANGEALWKFKSEMPVISTPVVDQGVVYFGGTDGFFYALDALSGEVRWKAPLADLGLSSPALAGGLIYIGSTDGIVHAIDQQDGAGVWTFHTLGEVWSTPVVVGETLYVGSFDSNLYALDRNGPKLAEVMMPTPRPLQPTPTPLPEQPTAVRAASEGLPWWNERVFYEIFVRSFSDSNGDGIGDLPGLIERLDYLNDGDPQTTDDLGVTGLWLMPVADSPSIHGYDATDFYKIEQDYGTNEDFQRLIEEAHKRGMAVIVDLVINHVSSEHPWFQNSINPGSDYENWFIWSDTNPGYISPWGTNVWWKAGLRYYYALFSPSQPDLNFRNGAVTEEIFKTTRFWLEEMGADGFRLDAIRHLIEDGPVQANTPETHAWLKDFDNLVHTTSPDALTVGEIWDDTANIVPYVGDEVNIAFEFRTGEAIVKALNQGSGTGLAEQLLVDLKSYPEGQFAPFLSNHDQTRVMSQLKKDPASAQLAATILFSLPGVPFVYYGEEIGLTGSLPDINVRRPMQWDTTATAGFTSGTPWLELGDDPAKVSVAAETDNPDSLLNHYRDLIHLRQTNPALLNGDTWVVQSSTPQVFALLRQAGEQAVLLVVNLSKKPVSDYTLSVENGALPGGLRPSVLYSINAGEGGVRPAALQANAGGGFDAYTPLRELPPQSAVVIELTPGD